MSGGVTSVSGMRSPGGSRRTHDTARIGKGISGGSITVHIIILGLAVLLWWIARDMVQVSRQLPNAGRVRFEISDELKNDWRVLSNANVPVSLDVSGPTKEINDFAAALEQNPGRFSYRYVITAADIANLPENSRRQVTLSVDMRRFETGDAVAPPELRVRPVGVSDKGGSFNVVLERYIVRDAYVDLGDTARGQIQVKLTDTGLPRPYTYVAEAKPTNPLRVRGPASLIEANSDTNGKGKLKVAIDARQALENFAKSKNLTVEQVLNQRTLVSNVQLPPLEGIEISDTQGLAVGFVNVQITYSQQQDYIEVSDKFPVEPIFPNWLARGHAYVENLPTAFPVVMRILSSQREHFNPTNVQVRLDLTVIDRASLNIESVEGTNIKRATADVHYSLSINTERLTYEFINETVTAEKYEPIGVVIVWTED